MTDIVGPGDALPIDIHASETIVRATKTPHHVNANKTRLRPAAFRPKVGSAVVSVMRQPMGDDFCKDKAVHICGAAYLGLSVITASEIRSAGALITDDRDEWLGHAHIDHQLPPVQKDEPLPAEQKQRLDDRCKALADACVLHTDPAPSVPGWSGSPLQLASPLQQPSVTHDASGTAAENS